MKRIILFIMDYEKTSSSGGNLARRTVKMLSENGFYVVVFTCGDLGEVTGNNCQIISLPLGIGYKTSLLLTRIGLIEDYLDIWVKKVLDYMEEEKNGLTISHDDTCICTSVGELGTFKIGHILKEKYGVRYVLHFHDPIKHAYVNGEKYGMFPLPYASRERYEQCYVQAADWIITSSDTFRGYLCNKYPFVKDKIENLYFGWMKDAKPNHHDICAEGKINIVYGGSFGWPQGPEILAMAAKGVEHVTITYVGNWNGYRKLKKLKQENVFFLDRMDHEEYMNYLMEKADVGFLSLSREYFSACIPAKLYEYINTNLPILAAVPESDTSRIINEYEYGISVEYNVDKLRRAIINLNYEKLKRYNEAIYRSRENWNFDFTMRGLIKIVY